MANTQVVGATLTKPQLAELKAEAEQLGISVPELLRRIVDEWREIKRRRMAATHEGVA